MYDLTTAFCVWLDTQEVGVAKEGPLSLFVRPYYYVGIENDDSIVLAKIMTKPSCSQK